MINVSQVLIKPIMWNTYRGDDFKQKQYINLE